MFPIKKLVQEDGTLEAFAWPGGYPFVYVDKDNSTLCSDCATKSLNDPDEIPAFKPVHGFYIEEAPDGPVVCEQCNKVIMEEDEPDEMGTNWEAQRLEHEADEYERFETGGRTHGPWCSESCVCNQDYTPDEEATT